MIFFHVLGGGGVNIYFCPTFQLEETHFYREMGSGLESFFFFHPDPARSVCGSGCRLLHKTMVPLNSKASYYFQCNSTGWDDVPYHLCWKKTVNRSVNFCWQFTTWVLAPGGKLNADLKNGQRRPIFYHTICRRSTLVLSHTSPSPWRSCWSFGGTTWARRRMLSERFFTGPPPPREKYETRGPRKKIILW